LAKFPTDIDESITVAVPQAEAYAYLWDVVRSAACIPGLARCEPSGDDVYRFFFAERSAIGISMAIRYSARYSGNGRDAIDFQSVEAAESNTDVNGALRLSHDGAGGTRIAMRQTVAPDTPVPRLLQGLARTYVQGEAAKSAQEFLANVKRTLESKSYG
jgi:carbon monoxide dehydrogenase subunit G